ncbi:MAG: DUF1853 family protein [Halioglobus sp.]|nr:DUF1853 family protein [Halioglobus sp.]
MHMADLADAHANVLDCTPALTPARRLWLDRLDRDATTLLQHLAQHRSHRLGLYFEQLWQFFLAQDPATELIAHNVPVQGEARTLGEFDCLYYCHEERRYVHLELAVKYYLAVPQKTSDGASLQRWVGPNISDRLDCKLAQLLERQIRLSESSAATAVLNMLGIANPRREIAFKGCLFQPITGALPPRGYNRQIPLSDWVTARGLKAYCATIDLRAFKVLPKRHWLSPHLHTAGDVVDSTGLSATVNERIAAEGYPLMVAALDDHGRERRRFMVVPEHWPGD